MAGSGTAVERGSEPSGLCSCLGGRRKGRRQRHPRHRPRRVQHRRLGDAGCADQRGEHPWDGRCPTWHAPHLRRQRLRLGWRIKNGGGCCWRLPGARS